MAEKESPKYEPLSVVRIFTLPDGNSAFGRISVPFGVDLGDIGTMSDWCPVNRLKFRVTPGSYDFDKHNAPREQLIINLDAAVEVTTDRDGAHVLEKGEIFFVEDCSGTGHKSKAVDGKLRHSIFIECTKASLESIGCVFSDEW